MGKFDQLGDLIRGLVSRPSRGVPLDVSDDVARAATRVDPQPDFSGIELDAGDDFLHAMDSAAPDFELGSPLWHQMDKGARAYDNLRRGRTPNLRNQDPQLARIAGQDIRARNADAQQARVADAERARGMREGATELGLAAATAGVPFLLSELGGEQPAGATTADLAAESRPVPEVASVEDEAPAMAPADPDYSFQARELINKLNAMRRAAGGEVPEAQSIMAEVNRLLELSNSQRNAPAYKPPMPTDYHGEAQRMLQQLNAMRQKAGGEVPQAQQMMAEIRRLQSMGDRMRNAG